MATSCADPSLAIRKLRKKLRQIERLETVNRTLTDEEKAKVARKEDIRNTLHEKLSELGDDWIEETNLSHETHQSSFGSDDVDNLLNYTSENHQYEPEFTEENSSLEPYNSLELEMKRKAEDSNEIEREEISVSDDQRVPAKVSKPDDGAGDNESRKDAKDEQLKPKNESSSSTKQVKKSSNSENLKPSKLGSQPSKSKPQTSKSNSSLSKSSSPATPWATAKFSVHMFEGHNDLILAVDSLGDTILSGGRDTMIKVWSMETKEEVHSFGGHTGTVTSVKLLDPMENRRLEHLVEDIAEGCELALSASLDCSIKLWCISYTSLLRSMYTYNPVTCMDYFPGVGYIISGSDGGKVELWDIESGNNLFSILAHDCVTCLWVEGSNAFTGSAEGVVKVWELREKSLVTIYSSEDLLSEVPSRSVAIKAIKCITCSSQRIYYGDDGQNIKVLEWKTGKLRKLKNQIKDFGLTDSVTVKDGMLISTGLDVDTGNSFINVRVLPEEVYVATITNDDIGRIVKLSITKDAHGSLRLVTAGSELIVWDLLKKRENWNQDSLSIEFVASLSTKAYDTDQNSDSDLSTDEEYEGIRTQRRRSSSSSTQQSSYWSWCSIC